MILADIAGYYKQKSVKKSGGNRPALEVLIVLLAGNKTGVGLFIDMPAGVYT